MLRNEYVRSVAHDDSDEPNGEDEEEFEMFEALEELTVPRTSIDYRRASTARSSSIQDTYRRFHAFIEILI